MRRAIRFLRRRWGWALAGAGVLYLLFVFVVADWVVIGVVPGAFKIPDGVRREYVVVGGKKVECFVARSAALAVGEAPAGYVLEFPGNATRAEWIAGYVPVRWREWPVETWVVSYPGIGGSEGWPTMKGMGEAGLGVFDELAKRGKPVFVEANSLGTTVALGVAARRRVAGCVLHDPVPLKQFIWGRHWWWNLGLVAGPVAWRVPEMLDSVANAKRVTAPCVFILAEKDDYVLPSYQRLVTQGYAGPSRTVLLRGAGHWSGIGEADEERVRKEVRWVWDRAERRTSNIER